jgi:hypothetical protein
MAYLKNYFGGAYYLGRLQYIDAVKRRALCHWICLYFIFHNIQIITAEKRTVKPGNAFEDIEEDLTICVCSNSDPWNLFSNDIKYIFLEIWTNDD